MIACWSKGSGLETPKRRKTASASGTQSATPSPEEEEAVYLHLGRLSEALPTRHQALVEEVLLGGGSNGLAYLEGPKVSVAFEGDVAVYFQGEIKNLRSRIESPACMILQQYTDGEWSCGGGEDLLGQLDGSFSVLVFDKLSGVVMVARDPSGGEPLYWGTSPFGEMMLFSNDRNILEAECADVDAFPAGTFFRSSPGEITGELTILQQPVDESDESEDLPEHEADGCGQVLARIASQHALNDLHRIGSSHQITAL